MRYLIEEFSGKYGFPQNKKSVRSLDLSMRYLIEESSEAFDFPK
jgi:hypothetical protein